MNSSTLWSAAMNDLPTLNPREYISIYVLDVFLGNLYTNPQTVHQATYLLSSWVFDRHPPTEVEIDLVGSLYSDIELARPIIFLQCIHNHFFVVLFDYRQRSCLVYGRHWRDIPTPVSNDAWFQWDGPTLWIQVAALIGLDEPDLPLSVKSIHWNQV